MRLSVDIHIKTARRALTHHFAKGGPHIIGIVWGIGVTRSVKRIIVFYIRQINVNKAVEQV